MFRKSQIRISNLWMMKWWNDEQKSKLKVLPNYDRKHFFTNWHWWCAKWFEGTRILENKQTNTHRHWKRDGNNVTESWLSLTLFKFFVMWLPSWFGWWVSKNHLKGRITFFLTWLPFLFYTQISSNGHTDKC